MPRGDGTGPWGTGAIGRGRGGCQGMGFGAGGGRGMRGGFGFADNTVPTAETLEVQAKRLEEQAANLRNLAKKNRVTE